MSKNDRVRLRQQHDLPPLIIALQKALHDLEQG